MARIPERVRGLYLVAPHGTLLATGEKRAVVKARKFRMAGEWLAILEDQRLLGVAKFKAPKALSLEEFRKTYDLHRVSPEERKVWWPGKRKLWLYPADEVYAYPSPIEYDVPPGTQTFLKEVVLPSRDKLVKVEPIEKLHLEEFRAEGIDYDLKRPKERRQQLIADLRYCLPPGSFVIRNPVSVTPIEDVKIGDVVWASGPAAVHQKYEHSHSGELIEIKPFGLPSVRLTENHPVLTCRIQYRPYSTKREREAAFLRKENGPIRGRKIMVEGKPRIAFYNLNEKIWKRADELKKDNLLFVPLPRVSEQATLDLKAYLPKWHMGLDGSLLYRPRRPGEHHRRLKTRWILLDKTLGFCVGLFLAEGDTSCGQGLRLSLHESERKLGERFLNGIEKIFGIQGSISPGKRHSLVIRVSSKYLASLFTKWCGKGARKKHLPDWIWAAPKACKLGLLEGLFLGDGTASWGDSHYVGQRYATVSPHLAYGTWLLLGTLGIFGKLSSRKIKSGFQSNAELAFEIGLRGTFYNVRSHIVFFDDDGVWIPIRKIRRVPYAGPVFNLGTSSESYCVPFLVHNCGNSAYPRLKAGKKWGDWTLDLVLRYFGKIVDTLRTKIDPSYFPEPPPGDPKWKTSWWQCYKEAKEKGYLKTEPQEKSRQAALGLVYRDGEILLIKRKNEPRVWSPPGGFLSGRDPVTAVLEEVQEETGVLADPVMDEPWREITVAARAKLLPKTDWVKPS